MIAFVFYRDFGVRKGFKGTTYGPFIFIRPASKQDVGLLEHEKTHVRQFWRSFGTFWLPYWLSKAARMRYEVEAYRVQATYNPERIEAFAVLLSTKYNLGITFEQALEALKRSS